MTKEEEEKEENCADILLPIQFSANVQPKFDCSVFYGFACLFSCTLPMAAIHKVRVYSAVR